MKPARQPSPLADAFRTLEELSGRPDFETLGLEFSRAGRRTVFRWHIYTPLKQPAEGYLAQCKAHEELDMIGALLIALEELRREPARKPAVSIELARAARMGRK